MEPPVAHTTQRSGGLTELLIGNRVLAHQVAGRLQLAQNELEPELVDLVHDDEEDLVQAFWEGWTVNGRSLWLMSYYLEESGDFEIRPRASLKPCKTCGGMGALQLLVTGTVLSGETASVASCPVCRGVKVTRRIYFR